MTLLLVNAAAVLSMTGVIWFVQVVHYPLFAAVGSEGWDAYHREHSRRTTWVVLPPMTADLVSSLALVVAAPSGVSDAVVVAGAVAAVATWAATGALAVPAHRRLAGGWQPPVARRLARANWVRTIAWSAHAALVLVALGQVA